MTYKDVANSVLKLEEFWSCLSNKLPWLAMMQQDS